MPDDAGLTGDPTAEPDDGAPLRSRPEAAPAAGRNGLAVVLAVVSGMGFLTLLKLVGRSNRTPARALGLFGMTSLESGAGMLIGFTALRQIHATEPRPPGGILALLGVAVGAITSVLTFNWMRLERRA